MESHGPVMIVGIGASAGGPEALKQLFAGVHADSGLAYVVVQHLALEHTNLLAQFLGQCTQMPVIEVQDGLPAEAAHVYAIAPGTTLGIAGGRFWVEAIIDEGDRYRPIDVFFQSLARDQGARAMGVVLSGFGTDGTEGLRAIAECGGLTLAQTPETAKHDDMPRNAIAAGVVQRVLAIDEIPRQLLEHAKDVAAGRIAHPPAAEPLAAIAPAAAPIDDPFTAHLDEIYEVLQHATGHDFRHYKRGRVRHRLQRRMRLARAESPQEYLALLSRYAPEAEILAKDLLVGTTQFFLDPEAFEYVRRHVLPRILAAKQPTKAVRIWVPGCASGEEAYSLAILVSEQLQGLLHAPPVQIFATDIDEDAIAKAREGRYPLDIAAHVSPERLARFFTPDNASYRVTRKLREMCLFSQHSLIRDPPFRAIDLISCRNVLLLLDAELQRRLVPVLHYALGRGGYLFLGASEDLAGHSALFDAVAKQARVFRRAEPAIRSLVEFHLVNHAGPRAAWPVKPAPTMPRASEQLPSSRFEQMGSLVRAAAGRRGVKRESPIEQLETELCTTDAELRTTNEELESANEELESANEELRSSNEELQLFNEEMQSSEEELQVVNEQLAVVNAELGRGLEELSRANSDLQNLLGSTDIATLFLDHELRIAKFTPAAGALFRLIEVDVGRPLSDLAPRLAEQDLTADAAEVLHTLRTVERQVETLDRQAWFLLRVLPYRTVEDVVAGVVITLADITQLKHAEAERERLIGELREAHDQLAKANQHLLEADRRKDEFLAILSHELRNPLAPIGSSLDVLDLAEPGSALAQRALAVIHRQFGHMSRMIQDLLDVTRVARDKVQLQREPLDLGELVQRTIEDHRESFVAAGIALESTPASGAVWVDGDPTRLAQVIGNLLQNAVKFTPRGGTVRVSVREDAASRRAIVRVQDTGRGIAPEILPRIFEPFIQAETTLDRNKGGLGLGLALVKGLTEAHGGSVTVASVLEGAGGDKGTIFTISLPLATGHRTPVDQPLPGSVAAAPPLHVLIIEDNVDAASSLRAALELVGHTVEVACTGPEGVERARALVPDVVLCDVGLPEMTGYEVARTLRATPALSRTSIVAVTGYGTAAAVAEARAAGFDAHVTKPVSIAMLDRVLAELGAARK